MILFFNLDIGQKFAKTAFAKIKNVGIVLSGNQFFRSNAVSGQKSIMLLVLRAHHAVVGSFWFIVTALGVIAVTGRKCAGKHLA